jgi:transposase
LAPEYGPRSAPPSKLDAFKPYLELRLRAGVWNTRVLSRELRERNYAGGYTILTDWLRPQRSTTTLGRKPVEARLENFLEPKEAHP